MSTPPDAAAIREPLRRWLGERFPERKELELGELGSAATGYSAQTWIVPLRFREDGRSREARVVLRVENPGPPVYPPQAPALDVEIDIQYRAMQAVASVSKLPLARLLGYEADAAVLGAPFFVMDYVAGETPLVEPPYSKEGFFFEARPDERRRMAEGGLRLLAELHAVDWRAAGLDWLIAPGTTPGTVAQLDLWERYLREHLGRRENPDAEAALAWLRGNVPPGLEPGLSWGDSRPGNVIWRDFEPVCVTDWENVAIAPPEMDAGWWLMFDRTCHDFHPSGAPRLDGDLTIDEQRSLYASLTGRDEGAIRYFEVFAALRYVAIITRMTNLYVERGVMPADHTLWRDSPPGALLRSQLDELGVAR